MAMYESKYGTSAIAIDKKNLFGIGAKNSNTYESANTFDSYEACIQYQAQRLTSLFTQPNTDYGVSGVANFYNGNYLGNKRYGMNVSYASDPYWGQKIGANMYDLDVRLGNRDYGSYRLGVVVSGNYPLRVRPAMNTTDTPLYWMRDGMIATVLDVKDVVTNGETWTWAKIVSDVPVNGVREAYVWVKNPQGVYLKIVKIS